MLVQQKANESDAVAAFSSSV